LDVKSHQLPVLFKKDAVRKKRRAAKKAAGKAQKRYSLKWQVNLEGAVGSLTWDRKCPETKKRRVKALLPSAH